MAMVVSDATRHLSRAALIALGLAWSVSATLAQPGPGSEIGWPPTSDALEACLIAEERSHATGHACIGRHARSCLDIAQREPVVHVERCYAPEVAAWATLMKRYVDERPKDARGQRLAEVQRAWLAYRKQACDYIDVHHGGGDLGRWQSLICLMEETARRTIALRSFRTRT
jgi:uncharacterized protein YecT (DUF1311 family)